MTNALAYITWALITIVKVLYYRSRRSRRGIKFKVEIKESSIIKVGVTSFGRKQFGRQAFRRHNVASHLSTIRHSECCVDQMVSRPNVSQPMVS